jgi:hypothetical protein
VSIVVHLSESQVKKFDGVGLIANPDFPRRREISSFFLVHLTEAISLVGELTSAQTSGTGAMGVVPLISRASKMPLPN